MKARKPTTREGVRAALARPTQSHAPNHPATKVRVSKSFSSLRDRRGTPPPKDMPTRPEQRRGLGLRRLGRSGVRRFGQRTDEEFDPRLRGRKAAFKFDEMSRNSHGIGGATLLIESLLSQVSLKFVVPDDCIDPSAAEPICDFYNSCLEDMKTPVPQVLAEWFSLIVHGFSLSETVYKIRFGDHEYPSFRSKHADGRVGWMDFLPLSQDSIDEWVWGETGDLIGLWQRVEGEHGRNYVPLAKCVHFVRPTAKRDPEGRSLLRNAFRPYFFRTAIEEYEAIGAERNLSGLPYMTVPPGLLTEGGDPDELREWEEMVRRVRRDEQEGLILPAEEIDGGKTGYKFGVIATGVNPSEADPIIQRHERGELLAVLCEFLALGASSTGSFALASSQTSTLSHALGALLRFVLGAFNAQEVPRLGRMNNFPTALLPTLQAGDIEDVDLGVIGAFLTASIGSGALTPDDNLEEHLRRVAHFPPRDRSSEANASPRGFNGPAAQITRAQQILLGADERSS